MSDEFWKDQLDIASCDIIDVADNGKETECPLQATHTMSDGSLTCSHHAHALKEHEGLEFVIGIPDEA